MLFRLSGPSNPIRFIVIFSRPLLIPLAPDHSARADRSDDDKGNEGEGPRAGHRSGPLFNARRRGEMDAELVEACFGKRPETPEIVTFGRMKSAVAIDTWNLTKNEGKRASTAYSNAVAVLRHNVSDCVNLALSQQPAATSRSRISGIYANDSLPDMKRHRPSPQYENLSKVLCAALCAAFSSFQPAAALRAARITHAHDADRDRARKDSQMAARVRGLREFMTSPEA